MKIKMALGFCMSVAMCAALASPANAARLGLRFADVGGALHDTQANPLAGAVLVEVTWEVTLQDIQRPPLTFVSLQLTSSPEDPNPGTQGDIVENPSLLMSDNSISVPGWQVVSDPGTAGGTGGFAAFALSPANAITTPGTTVIGTFRLDITDFGGLGEFYIARNPSAFTPQVDAQFESFSYNPFEDGYGPEYSIATGFAGNDDGTGALPLALVIPEPASIAVLVIGAAWVGRRHGKRR